jgi:hypothetical protein
MKYSASSTGINVGNVDLIIHEPLFFKKMGPKDVMSNQRAQHVALYAEHLHWFELEGNPFQSQSVPAWKLHKP